MRVFFLALIFIVNAGKAQFDESRLLILEMLNDAKTSTDRSPEEKDALAKFLRLILRFDKIHKKLNDNKNCLKPGFTLFR